MPQQPQPSKLFLVAKDFSLRSPAGQSGTAAGKRSLDTLNGSPVKIDALHNKQAGVDTTTTKRPRINGTVIDVNEVIQAAAAVNAAAAQPPSAVAMTVVNNNTNTNSKYVTGSFDLEEHIRALPQLTQPAVVQLRNAQSADGKSVTTPNLLVVTSKGVVNSSAAVANGFVGFPATSITSKHSNIVNAATSKPSLIALATGGGHPGEGFPLRVVSTSGAAALPTAQHTLARVQTSVGAPAAAAGAPVFIQWSGGAAGGAGGGPIAVVDAQSAMSIATPLVTMVNRLADGSTSTMSAVSVPNSTVATTGGNIHTPATNLILAAAAAAATANQGNNHVGRPVDLSTSQAAAAATVVSRPSQAYLSALVTSQQQSLPIISLQSSSAVNASPLTISTTTADTAATTSSGQSSPMLSTVISSQGSINQCDGLAALAEIALAQQARLN